MLIGVPAETRPGETRVAATAETVKKLVAASTPCWCSRGGAGCQPDDEMYVAAARRSAPRAQALAAEMC